MSAKYSTTIEMADSNKIVPHTQTVTQIGSPKNTMLTFDEINYSVLIKKGPCSCVRQAEKKVILTDVSGIMKPGLNAIMGPTGSGKSSLLDVLAGRKDPKGLTGEVLINGVPLPKNFKRISGYVVQKDIAVGTLTVRENLWFSANMRLPRSLSKEAKRGRIEETLMDLGLTGCADTKVGTELIRGISGGEKKRACIAIELITQPSVLFLDEPTTGLDASTANAVMVLLQKLGSRGRTIIFSIHQPRYSIFRLFDSLTLLSAGRMVYHGPLDNALPYFERLGYQCEQHNNPADFFLDVINGDSTALARKDDVTAGIEPKRMEAASRSSGIGADKDDVEKGAIVATKSSDGGQTVTERLTEEYERSELCSDTKRELKEINEKRRVKISTSFDDIDTYATPFYYQLGVLLKRAFVNVIRNPIATVGNLFVNIVIGVVFGLLYYQVDDSASTGTQNRFGVLFFITTNLLFSSLSSIEIFIKEKDIFVHEYVSGYYRVIAYFLAKLFADLIPMRTVGPIVFCSVTYWMVGLKATASAFFLFLLMVLLLGYAAVAIALFFSATFDTYAVSNLFITLTFVFSILFAGLLLNVESILPWLGWIKYLSISNYGFSGLAINEFQGQTFSQCLTGNSAPPTTGTANCTQFYIDPTTNQTCYNITGECFLSSQLGIGDGSELSEWELWQNYIAIFCISIGMYFLTYVQLARTKTTS